MKAHDLKGKNFLKLLDFTPEEIQGLIDFAVDLKAMKKAGEPLNAGKIAELTGLDRKVVDKTMTAMKKEGSIIYPIRCKWEPAEK